MFVLFWKNKIVLVCDKNTNITLKLESDDLFLKEWCYMLSEWIRGSIHSFIIINLFSYDELLILFYRKMINLGYSARTKNVVFKIHKLSLDQNYQHVMILICAWWHEWIGYLYTA